MLSGLKIKELVEQNKIFINMFDRLTLGPNSVDLTLDRMISVAKDDIVFDARNSNYKEYFDEIDLFSYSNPMHEYVLMPGKLYLASVRERIDMKDEPLVTYIGGKSSLARLGLQVHMTASHGQVGWSGNYVLEMTVTNPLVVYYGMRICQLFIERIEPDSNGQIQLYDGKYQHQSKINI